MSTGAIPSPMAGYNDMSDTILSNGKAKKKKKDFTSYWQRSPSSNAIPLTYPFNIMGQHSKRDYFWSKLQL